MTTKINANAGTGLTETIDATGILELQTANTTAVIIGTDQNANFTSTGAITLPAGTTGQRPSGANVANGMLRYNTSTTAFEAYLNSNWASVTNATTYAITYLIVAGGELEEAELIHQVQEAVELAVYYQTLLLYINKLYIL